MAIHTKVSTEEGGEKGAAVDSHWKGKARASILQPQKKKSFPINARKKSVLPSAGEEKKMARTAVSEIPFFMSAVQIEKRTGSLVEMLTSEREKKAHDPKS